MTRRARGHRLPASLSANAVSLSYQGLDAELRFTSLGFQPTPTRLTPERADFDFVLQAEEQKHFRFVASCQRSLRQPSERQGYSEAHESLGMSLKSNRASSCCVRTSNSQFDAWWNRSMWDLQLLTTTVATGKYPYAGIPWFNTPFGRDGPGTVAGRARVPGGNSSYIVQSK